MKRIAMAVAVGATMLFVGSAARAGESTGAVAPPPAGHVVTFEKTRAWWGSWGETWTLRDGSGATVCDLPCTTLVPSASGYVLEGTELGPWYGGKTYVVDTLRRPVEIDAVKHPEWKLEARMVPQTGSPNGAIALGVAGALLVSGGAALLIHGAVEGGGDHATCDACFDGAGIVGGAEEVAGGVLVAVGVALGIGGAVMAAGSERAHLELTPAAPPTAGLTVSVSPTGITALF